MELEEGKAVEGNDIQYFNMEYKFKSLKKEIQGDTRK